MPDFEQAIVLVTPASPDEQHDARLAVADYCTRHHLTAADCAHYLEALGLKENPS